MKYSLTLLLVFLLVGLTGCNEEPTPTQVTATIDKDSPPAVSGIIVRGETVVAVTWVDWEAGLRVVIGADMDEFCADIYDFDFFAYQDGTLPDGRTFTVGVGGNMQTRVWDFLEWECDLLTTIPPIAVGTSRLMNVDNSLAGVGEDDNFTNTWAWSAQGVLVGADGGRAPFNGFLRQVYGNDGVGYLAVSVINLH